MKSFYKITVAIFLMSSFTALNTSAQSTPQWTRDITGMPDTAATAFPVRTLTTSTGEAIVLSNFFKQTGQSIFEYKIILRKYDYAGNQLWNYVFDNSGNNDTRAYDMALDNNDNVYIAGSVALTASSGQPLLLKVNDTGTYQWMKNSVTAFSLGSFDKVIIRNNRVYTSSTNGLAQFDFNGNEYWSHAYMVSAMAVDNAGQTIFSAYVSNPNTIFRLDVNGNVNFSDMSIMAKRITVDNANNFYLLSDNSGMTYAMVKYSSAGTFQWNYTSFPTAPPFGDIGMDILVDANNDVIVVGVNDTIYKFSPNGNLQWIKPMNGLDNYLISATITGNNIIAVAGNIPGGGGYDMGFTFFNLFGNPAWSGTYSGNVTQEFTKDMAIAGSDVYIIEDNNQNTTLAKFQLQFLGGIDFSLICIDSVWYDPINPQFINVSVFNGNVNHLNYPSVQIVSPAGDTIGNPSNFVNFFAHLDNTYQTYSDTITVPGITDFSNYTFLVSDGFGDTTVAVNWCNVTSITDVNTDIFSVFPNPASEYITIHTMNETPFTATLYNNMGQKIKQVFLSGNKNQIELSSIASGMYYLIIHQDTNKSQHKILKQ